MTAEQLCRECDRPITHRAKCGALICGACCQECRKEDDGICPTQDFKYAEAQNNKAQTYIR
jgi:hypothetical protein